MSENDENPSFSEEVEHLEAEIDLTKRHLDVLEPITAREPIGINAIEDELGYPRHEIRDSLRVLEAENLVEPSSQGVILADGAVSRIESYNGRIDDFRERIERAAGDRIGGADDTVSSDDMDAKEDTVSGNGMDAEELARDAEGAVPPELLEKVVLKEGILSKDSLPVEGPLITYLEDSEQPQHIVPTKKFYQHGEPLYRGKGIAVLTDRRLLITRGDDFPPCTVRYENVSRVEVKPTGKMSHDQLRIVGDSEVYTMKAGTGVYTRSDTEYDLLQKADGDVLDRDEARQWLDDQVAYVKSQMEHVETWLDEMNATFPLDDGTDGDVSKAAIETLLGAYEASEDVADDVDPTVLSDIDKDDVENRLSELRNLIERRYERWVEMAENELMEGQPAVAVSTAADARSLVERAPLPSTTAVAYTQTLVKVELQARTLDGDTSGMLSLARDCFQEGIRGVDDSVSFVTETLHSAAERDEAAAAAIVADIVPRLGQRRESKLATVIERQAEEYPSLVADVPLTDVAGLLKHSDAATRQMACTVLAEVGTSDELDRLRELEDDDVYGVRVAAMAAMKAIAERENVTLSEHDREQLREVNIRYEGSGDVVTGDYEDQSTAVEDSVVNRADIGGADSESADGELPSFCPSCGGGFEEYSDPAFCPNCGFDL